MYKARVSIHGALDLGYFSWGDLNDFRKLEEAIDPNVKVYLDHEKEVVSITGMPYHEFKSIMTAASLYRSDNEELINIPNDDDTMKDVIRSNNIDNIHWHARQKSLMKSIEKAATSDDDRCSDTRYAAEAWDKYSTRGKNIRLVLRALWRLLAGKPVSSKNLLDGKY